MATDVQPSEAAQKMIADMQKAQDQSLAATTAVNKATTEFNTNMQGLKMQHSSNKAYIDALKGAANNVAQMGRPQ